MLALGRSPMAMRMNPMANITPIIVMKKYVGTRNIDPDSRRPRRLP